MFADFTIVCSDGQHLPAHKILLVQSPFFKAALSVDMKVVLDRKRFQTFPVLIMLQEKRDSVIRLPESSEVIRPMLEFLYTSKYGVWKHTKVAPFLRHAEIYTSADTYQVPELCLAVCQALRQDVKECLITQPRRDINALLMQEDEFLQAAEYIFDNTLHKRWDAFRTAIIELAKGYMLSLSRGREGCEKENWIERMIVVPKLMTELMASAIDELLWVQERASCVELACRHRGCKSSVIIDFDSWRKALRAGASVKCPGCLCTIRIRDWKFSTPGDFEIEDEENEDAEDE